MRTGGKAQWERPLLILQSFFRREFVTFVLPPTINNAIYSPLGNPC